MQCSMRAFLVKPIVGRDLVKICMGTASTMYEDLVFFAQAKSEGRTWLEWKARTFSVLRARGCHRAGDQRGG
jgi:hypothetical protein